MRPYDAFKSAQNPNDQIDPQEDAFYEIELISHGLSKAEPLNFELLLECCFKNPVRKRHPFFWSQRAFIGEFTLDETHQNASYFLSEIDQSLVKNFNQSEINLHDTARLWANIANQENFLEVDKSEYLRAISDCSWHGPFVEPDFKFFYFFSVSGRGENEYYVVLRVDLDKRVSQGIWVYFCKNAYLISDALHFKP